MSEYLHAMLGRRSIYGISAESTLPDDELAGMLGQLVKKLPTAYNMQSSCAVLLLGQQHQALWRIVHSTLQQRVPAESFPRTEKKLAGFAAGYGSVLFFDDDAITQKTMADNPQYAQNFPPWVQQHNGMLQLAVWAALEDIGMGASLQHYNPIIDDEVKATFGLPASWTLLAQMPFGKPTAPAGEKTFLPLEQRFKVLK